MMATADELTRECVKCGVAYLPKTARQRYCSKSCKDRLPRISKASYPTSCSFPDCDQPFYANSLCKPHNLQAWAGKELYPLVNRQKYTSTYRRLSKKGYVEIYRPGHPNAQKGGMMMEHVFVMSEFLGRPLTPKETVHHINLQKDDNRIENLQLRQGQHGKGAVFVCGDCNSINVIAVPISDPN